MIREKRRRRRSLRKDVRVQPQRRRSNGSKTCMKYSYSNDEDYEDLNLPCEERKWPGGMEKFNNVDDYRPSQMNEYINRYFSNSQFNGKSPFVYQQNYLDQSVEDLCFRKEFVLNPHQRFPAMFINGYTNFKGMLLYNGLGSGKTSTSLVIGEAMKSLGLDQSGELVNLPGRGPFKVFVVAPKNVQEQYYEELIGRVRDNTIQSVSAACVILEGPNDVPIKQIYVGNYNPQTGQYYTRELSIIDELNQELDNLKIELGETDNNIERQRIRKRIKDVEGELKSSLNNIKEKINAVYYIVSHDKFLNMVMKTVKIGNRYISEPTNFLLSSQLFHSDNSLIIIDEVQKMVREFSEETGSNYRRLYYTLMHYARNRESGKPAMKVVLLTATPVYDNPHEAALMINLLRPRIPFPLKRDKFNSLFINNETGKIKNKLLFQYMCSGYVGYFAGGNPNGYPYRKNIIKMWPMESIQEQSYTDALVAEVKKERNRLAQGIESDSGTQFTIAIQKCNITYPIPEGSEEIKNTMADIHDFSKLLIKVQEDVPINQRKRVILNEAKKYSAKLSGIVDLIEESPGPVFIYSNWVNHGILGIVSILNALGFEYFRSTRNPSAPRYAVWSPGALEKIGSIEGLGNYGLRDERRIEEYIKNMRTIFNSPENADGSLCKVLIGNVVEGVSLRRVTQVHICEPWWNESKIEQIVARAIRYCSHADVPENQQYVDVYFHVSVYSSFPDYNTQIQNQFRDEGIPRSYRDLSRSTIEQKMYLASHRKTNVNLQFENSLKQSAIDCNLNKHGNVIRLEEMEFPEFDKNIYYNRSTGKYYLARNNKLKGIDLIYDETIEDGEYESDVKNWPPLDYESNGEVIRNVNIEPALHDNESLSIVLSEDIGCDIDNPVTSDLKFKDLYRFATEHGEEKEAWKYCYNMFRKNELFPYLITKYNILQAGRGGNISNCLYQALANPKTNGLNNTEMKRLERFLIHPQALIKNKEVYKKILMRKTNLDVTTLESMNYVQLEILAKKFLK